MERAKNRAGDDTVFIYRKGNGGAFVSKSPAVVKANGTLWVVNLTECEAQVRFPDGFSKPRSATLPPKGGHNAFVVIGALGYYEYRVTLTCARGQQQDVEASSHPGAIIDP